MIQQFHVKVERETSCGTHWVLKFVPSGSLVFEAFNVKGLVIWPL